MHTIDTKLAVDDASNSTMSRTTGSRSSDSHSVNSFAPTTSDLASTSSNTTTVDESISAGALPWDQNGRTKNRPTNQSEIETDSTYRAVHQIRLTSLTHNYNLVESAAAQQMCSVIVVAKADGYGHGAVQTALHLADKGADAFAVATLEEAILLRKALQERPKKWNDQRSVAANVTASPNIYTSLDESDTHTAVTATCSTAVSPMLNAISRRPPLIRILVLGPPVGFPLCFDDYFHYSIECMVSGPEVAAALMQWIANPLDHKRRLVERVAKETKEQIEDSRFYPHHDLVQGGRTSEALSFTVKNSATLSGISGQDLVKEYKQFVINQQKATQFNQSTNSNTASKKPSPNCIRPTSSGSLIKTFTTKIDLKDKSKQPEVVHKGFSGIEAAALSSRNREKAAASCIWIEDSVSDQSPTNSTCNEHDHGDSNASKANTPGREMAPPSKRRLRWHAVVDTGMRRIGFKTEIPSCSSERRDTVEILQELVNAEVKHGAPIEFFGMCSHMADASSTSTYTQNQIEQFKVLLKRVRDAGISVPTISTDNSAALLTTSLTHFDPNILLSQPGFRSRGFVRVGGAIYGQRPAFSQLQPVSTLRATVRHVAVVKEGESVGYDRAFLAPYNVRIATLAIGFADGYPRELGNGRGQVSIRSKLYPVAGNVCMDMMMVMLGPVNEDSDVRVGDSAILWGGEDGVPLKDVAVSLGTTQSALTCGLNKSRIRREYVP